MEFGIGGVIFQNQDADVSKPFLIITKLGHNTSYLRCLSVGRVYRLCKTI